tara:strand:+ start:3129 stop:3767 length:639 start_codon:yes stop_codon:yes gene_type:complete
MNKLFIFGTKETADLADFYFKTDSQFDVVGFTEDQPTENFFNKKPIIDYEDLKKKYNSEDHLIFAPIIKNSSRYEVFNRVKKDGYSMPSYISSKANLWNKEIVGENCFIQELNNIQYGTTLGNNCILWAGNHIGHHGKIGHNVFFTSHVVLSGQCEVGDFSYFGVNSTIRDGLQIAEGTMIGMGCNQTKNTEEWSFYLGSPGKRIGNSKKYL